MGLPAFCRRPFARRNHGLRRSAHAVFNSLLGRIKRRKARLTSCVAVQSQKESRVVFVGDSGTVFIGDIGVPIWFCHNNGDPAFFQFCFEFESDLPAEFIFHAAPFANCSDSCPRMSRIDADRFGKTCLQTQI